MYQDQADHIWKYWSVWRFLRRCGIYQDSLKINIFKFCQFKYDKAFFKSLFVYYV